MKKNNIFSKVAEWFQYFGWGWVFPFNHLSAIFHPIKFIKCLRYPFLKVRNRWTGKFMGYSFTEDESIPVGWYKAFGKDLLKDIKQAGKKSRKRAHKYISWKKLITWEQIKEKYGSLRLYASATEEIMQVLFKYELLSEFYCISCGKKAKYVTPGWIEYLCEDCFNHYYKDREDIEDIKADCLIKIELPENYKELEEKYNINFKELLED